MNDLVKRLELFEQKLNHFSHDLAVLQQLHHINDPQAQLNKIRYISEGILQTLCKENEVSWGKAEPTLERMIGPLRAADIIPAPIASHLRSIQSTTSPGSHYQEDKLNSTHAQIATMALIELLEWYLQEYKNTPISSTESPSVVAKTTRIHTVYLSIFVVIVLLGIGYHQYFTVSSDHPSLQETRAREALLEFQKNFSIRHYAMTKLANKWGSLEDHLLDTLTNDEDFQTYRTVLNTYNITRGIYRTEIEAIFGEEFYLWERQIHLQLLYTGKNLECIVNQKGVRSEQIKLAQDHLSEANQNYRNFLKMTEQLLQKKIDWPIPVTRSKSALEPQFEHPC